MRAEAAFTGILKTLNAEYSKIQDSLVNMLSQVLKGNSLELMLSIATVEGKMKQFVSKLIKYNEFSNQAGEAPDKPAANRPVLFEITFLMLCSIVQTYGPDVSITLDS